MKKFLTQLAGKPLVIITLAFMVTSVTGQESDIEMSLVFNSEDKNLVWGPCPDFMPEGCDVSVLHGDPAKGNADILFRLQPDAKVPNHWHTSAERMILVAGELEVAYEGEDPRVLKAGDYAYGPAKKPHTAKCGSSEPCVLFIAFNEPIDAIAVPED